MPYLSLYRKYRSQSFEELAGQEHVTRTLQNAVRAGRVAHAYLFSGPRGTGKTSSARLLARALNCERGPTPTPCGECVACQEIRDGISTTVVEIDAASSRGIDEVRDLRQRAMTVPSQAGARKVFIIDEVHMLTTEACNALLKTLEEPPAHVLFVLATTDAQKLPATILSRCQRFEFRRGSVGVIGERLRFVAESEGCTIEPEAVRQVARAAAGSWRDAISLLEQVLAYGGSEITAAQVAAVLGAVEEEALFELAEGMARRDGKSVYPAVEAVISAGTEPRQLARDLGEHFRALLMAEAGALPSDSFSREAAERLLSQAARFGTVRLVAALEALSQAEKEMRWSDSGRILLEVALARLMMSPAEPELQAAIAPASGKQPAANRVADGQGAPPISPARPPAPVAKTPGAVNDRPLVGADPNGVGLADSRRTAEGNSRKPVEPDRDAAAPQPAPVGVAGADPGIQPGEAGPEAPELDPFEHEEIPPLTGRNSPARAGAPRLSIPSSPALDPVKERWNVILEELKRKRAPRTHALLTEAQPLRCDEAVLVIGFRYGGHLELWERGDNNTRLAAAIEAVLGRRLQVRAEILCEESTPAASPGPPAPSPEPAKAAASPASPAAPGGALQGEALLHEVIVVFEGHVVETTD